MRPRYEYFGAPNALVDFRTGMKALHQVARRLLDLGRCVRVVFLRDAFADVVSNGSRAVAEIDRRVP